MVGMNDLIFVSKKIKQHEDSIKHMKNLIDLAMIGKVKIAH